MSNADRYASIIIEEGRRRGMTDRGIKIALATALVESDMRVMANRRDPASLALPHDGVGQDYDSVGLFQQRPPWGPVHVRMDPAGSAGLFYAQLARLNYNSTAHTAGWYAAEVQRPAAEYRGRYDERMPQATLLFERLAGGDGSFQDSDRELLLAVARQVDQRRTQQLMSRSPFRALGEGPIHTEFDFEINEDGGLHTLLIERLVRYGDTGSLKRLQEVAFADPILHPQRSPDIALARRTLRGLGHEAPEPFDPVGGQGGTTGTTTLIRPTTTRRTRFWPLGRGRHIYDVFGTPRGASKHLGVDFGREGGSAGMPVYAVQSGTVIHSGAAQGYGGPDPCGWLVIDSSTEEGGGAAEYGHIVREVSAGQHVTAGQRIAHVNPNSATNGAVPPHLHLSVWPHAFGGAPKVDPLAWLGAAVEPE